MSATQIEKIYEHPTEAVSSLYSERILVLIWTCFGPAINVRLLRNKGEVGGDDTDLQSRIREAL